MNDIQAIKEVLAGCATDDIEQKELHRKQGKSSELEALVSEAKKQTELLETIKSCVMLWTVLLGISIGVAIIFAFIAANI